LCDVISQIWKEKKEKKIIIKNEKRMKKYGEGEKNGDEKTCWIQTNSTRYSTLKALGYERGGKRNNLEFGKIRKIKTVTC
jgi:hypothetical protein